MTSNEILGITFLLEGALLILGYIRTKNFSKTLPMPPQPTPQPKPKVKPFGEKAQAQLIQHLTKLETCYIEILTAMSLEGFTGIGKLPEQLAWVQKELHRISINAPE